MCRGALPRERFHGKHEDTRSTNHLVRTTMPAEGSQAAWPRIVEPRSRFRAIDLAFVLAALAFAFGLTIVTMNLDIMSSQPEEGGALAASLAPVLASQSPRSDVSGEATITPMPDRLRAPLTTAVSWAVPVPQAIAPQEDRGPVDGDHDRRAFLLNAARRIYAPPTESTRGLATGLTHCCPR